MLSNCGAVSCGLSHISSELDAMLLDPTLDSCCRRDLEDQKKTAQLKSKLLSLDRTNQRLKHGSILLSTQPHGQKPLESHAAERDASDEDSDFGSNDEEAPDPQIERLRQMRIEEMKRKAQADSQASSLGYGCVNELHWRQVVHKAEEVGGYCICHLSVDGHESCSQLDEVLDGLSHLYPKTLFLRSPSCPTRGSHASTLISTLGLQDYPPALICFRGGSVVGRCHLESFGPYGDLMEEQVVDYLKRLRALREASAAGKARGDKGRAAELDQPSSDDDQEEEEGRNGQGGGDPCEICGRRYQHEHVKSIYTTRGEGDEVD